MFTIPTNEPVPPDAFINEKQTAISWDITLFAKPQLIKNPPKPAHGVASPFRR
jgi:hypothetical protein